MYVPFLVRVGRLVNYVGFIVITLS